VVIPQDELQVHDLKDGHRRVWAEENEQLMTYALAALDKYSAEYGPFKRVRLFIHQPRLSSGPSEWECSLERLEQHRADLRSAGDLYRMAKQVREVWQNNPKAVYYTVGEKVCEWCAHKVNCVAYSAFVSEAVGAEFEVLAEKRTPKQIKADPVALAPVAMDGATLGQKYLALPLVLAWAKAVDEEAAKRLNAGQPVDGLKLVIGRQGNRAWTDEAKAEEAMKAMRLKEAQMYKFTLLSPTQAEELLAESPRKWAKLQHLIGRSEGKPTVARADDPREAYVPGGAEDFDSIPAEDFGDLV
jgi:hypothetical protein